MKIGVISDIHDNVWTLKAALANLQHADILLCGGDLCSPFVVGLMAEGFGGPIHIVEGNNEGDWRRITQQASKYPHVHLCGEFFQDEVDGKRIAVSHYPDVALPVAQSGKYDIVFYGHNHRFAVEHCGASLMVNPGALLGYDPVSKQDIAATFVLYDTHNNEARGYRVPTKITIEDREKSIVAYP